MVARQEIAALLVARVRNKSDRSNIPAEERSLKAPRTPDNRLRGLPGFPLVTPELARATETGQ